MQFSKHEPMCHTYHICQPKTDFTNIWIPYLGAPGIPWCDLNIPTVRTWLTRPTAVKRPPVQSTDWSPSTWGFWLSKCDVVQGAGPETLSPLSCQALSPSPSHLARFTPAIKPCLHTYRVRRERHYVECAGMDQTQSTIAPLKTLLMASTLETTHSKAPTGREWPCPGRWPLTLPRARRAPTNREYNGRWWKTPCSQANLPCYTGWLAATMPQALACSGGSSQQPPRWWYPSLHSPFPSNAEREVWAPNLNQCVGGR